MTPSQPTKEFEAAVHEALQLWRQESEPAGPLANLALVRQRQKLIGGNLHRAANQVLSDAVDSLAAEHEADAALLRARFLDGKKVFVAANERSISATMLYNLQRRAVERLAAVLWLMEERASARQRSVLQKRLPPATYTELFGLDTHLAEAQRGAAGAPTRRGWFPSKGWAAAARPRWHTSSSSKWPDGVGRLSTSAG